MEALETWGILANMVYCNFFISTVNNDVNIKERLDGIWAGI